jgi:inorganic triphosphatase YgiF
MAVLTRADATPQEVELKLRLPPESRTALSRLALPGVGSRPVSERLYSVYFDTPELALKHAGVTLRLRRAGRRWIQTVKGTGGAAGGLHTRREWEWRVPGPQPDLSVLPPQEMPLDMQSPAIRDALRPVFVTDLTRRRRMLAFEDGDLVEFAVDRGEVRAEAAARDICEIELELKGGRAARLFEIGLLLARALPVRLEQQSKAEYGYGLAEGTAGAPCKATATALAADTGVNEAYKAILSGGLAHLQANEDGMLDGRDPEYLHQMRVALRRLRSAFGLFRDLAPRDTVEPLVGELRWLTACLGPARDWDVFLTETLPGIRGAPAIGAFVHAAEARRAGALAVARDAVRSTRYQEMLLGLGAWIATEPWLAGLGEEGLALAHAPVVDFAALVLERRYRRVVKRGRGFTRLEATERHRLRIAMKKLRYAAEFFSDLFPEKPTRVFLRSAMELQDLLGALNDAATTTHLLQETREADGAQSLIGVAGYIEGWVASDATHRVEHSRVEWKRFLAETRFWKRA